MQLLTNETFDLLIKDAPIRPRYKRELKFTRSTENVSEAQWDETELLPIWNKSEQGGILLLQPYDELTIIPFDANKPSVSTTGRSKSVICDFCFTWRAPGEGRFITFYPYKDNNSISLLCCADLRCSEHVRSKTDAALKSRTQLREDITQDGRVERLKGKLDAFLQRVA